MTIMPICTICNTPINDLYHLIVGNKLNLHIECLKCSVCKIKLEMQAKCYLNNGKFYCTNDYLKTKSLGHVTNEDDLIHLNRDNLNLNSANSCKTCEARIESNEYVIRIRLLQREFQAQPLYDLYHLNCFQCFECKSLIAPGDKYGILNDNNVYCSRHFFKNKPTEPQTQQDYSNNDHSANHHNLKNQPLLHHYHHLDHNNNANYQVGVLVSSSSVASCTSTSPSASSTHSSPLSALSSIDSSTSTIISKESTISNSLKSKKTSGSTVSSNRPNSPSPGPLSHNLSQSFLNSISNASKKKRMRTSFKHQQLRIMKVHFLSNPNPDSKDLKELSERTGLQKRVLQVWFQNSRAKQRKSSANGPNISSNSNDNYSGSSSNLSKKSNDESIEDDCDKNNEDEVNELLEIEDNFNLDNNEDEDDDGNNKNGLSVEENFKFSNENSFNGTYGGVVSGGSGILQHQQTLINFYSYY